MDRIQAVREVMTLEEVAEYLQVSEKSVLRMAQSGKIPAAKVASQWRFMRSVVDDWLMAQMEIPSVRSAPARKEPPKLPPLTELMPATAMNLEVTPGTKDEVLKQLVEPLRESKILRQPRRLLESVLERERMVSTAIGHGIAIPHPRRPISGSSRNRWSGWRSAAKGLISRRWTISGRTSSFFSALRPKTSSCACSRA